MEILFYVSWRHSASGEFCDQSVIDSGTLIGEGKLRCLSGCSGCVSSMFYRCTDFSIEEDWSFGERLLTHTFDGGPDITIGFTGMAWIAPFHAGALQHHFQYLYAMTLDVSIQLQEQS